MKVKFLQFPEDVQRVYDSTLGCRQALNNLAKGRPATPSNKFFYPNKSIDWVKNQVENKLKSMKDLKELSDWDLGFMPKFGFQGEAAPLELRLDGFNEYFEHLDAPLILKDPKFKEAQRLVIKALGFNESGDPISVDQVIEQGLGEDKYNTTSAYNLYIRKKDPRATRAAKMDAPTCIKRKFPNTPGTRATPGKTGVDARNIFMTAMAVVVNGQRFQKPLQEYLRTRQLKFFTPWEGFDTVQSVASKFEDRTVKLSADYDKMDQHFNKFHGMAVFEVIKHYFKRKYWNELEEIIGYVFSQPILTNLGYIDQDHALVSGSEWTNFLETLWNIIFWTYFELKYHIKVKNALGIGDDQVVEFANSERWSTKTMDRILDLIIRNYDYAGTPGNKDKNLFSRDSFEFCQRKAVVNYLGYDGKTKWALVYRMSRCAEMNKCPETFHNEKMLENGKKVAIFNKFTAAIQTIMRSENMFQHPLFKSFWINFIWQSDPVIREFVALKDNEVLEQEKRARKITNLYPTYNQEKANKPITEFLTFKLLREKVRA
jgi:hypothetical protein